MQQPVSNDNKTSTSSINSINSSMSPQVQHLPQDPTMQQLQQPIHSLSQLNQMNWQPQHQPSNDQSQQGQLLLPSDLAPSSPKLSSDAHKSNTKSPSPTNLSVVSNSSKSSSKTKGSRSSSKSSHHSSLHQAHTVKRGSGVEIKGPTPEVAQQLRFPWKLHLLLERCEYEQKQKHATCAAEGKNPASLSDMPISWLPCGKAFKVHDKERFVQEIMPSFFGTQSFKTFQRNLNLWGFTRVSKGPQKDVCSHPLFLKGFPAVCQSMKRIVLKGTGRGNRAPLGGVDVSSVQAVVAAAAMQQAHQQAQQQQQQQQQQQHSIGMAGMNNGGINQIPNHIQAQQVLQQQQIQTHHKNNTDQQNSLNHFHHQNQQQNQQQQQQQLAQNHQQQQFVIENGSIVAAPMPSQQKLVVLPSPLNPNNSATTSVMWPNNVNQPLQQQQQQMQQHQSLNAADANANLQKSLQQLSAIIQQLNGCNAVSTAAVNTNSVNINSNSNVNNNNFQQQQQLQVGPTPIPTIIQQQQQSSMMQQQQQPLDPNTVVAPAPMSTQDLVALLLQRNLQQQVCQVQAAPQQPQSQIQLQVPTSLFPSGPFSTPQPTPTLQQQQQQQQPIPFAAANATNFSQTQQQGSMMGNNANMFQQQQQAQPVAAATPSPTPSINGQQQQNQLLQLLLQQNGWATQSST